MPKCPSRFARRKSVFPIAIISLVLLFTPKTVSAYDNDTHFWLTYYLAIKAGYTRIQATQIASADVTLDLDADTTPVLPSIETPLELFSPLKSQQEVRARLHALPSKAKIVELAKLDPAYWWDPLVETDPKILAIMRKLVAERKAEYWKATISQPRNPGLFLHYLQDTFAHDGFKSLVGHSGYYRVDFLASDRSKAETMAMMTLRYLIAFREVYFAKKLAADFLDPERIDLGKYLSPADIAEVKATVKAFADANPSSGVTESPVVLAWKETSAGDKADHKRTPPYRYVNAFRAAKKMGACPDSSKARAEVMRILKVDERSLPGIWKFALHSDGSAYDKMTDDVFVYQAPGKPSKNTVFNGDDEAANKKKTNIKDEKGRKQCLPFTLVPVTQTELPLCK